MLLIRDRHPEQPAYEMAVTEALLRAVAARRMPSVARVFRPGPTVAFGRRDVHLPGFAAAREAAAAAGFAPVVRLGGGHAAAYDEGCVLLELVTAQEHVATGLQERYAFAADTLVAALAAVGVDAAVGEVPGEYCPGRWSVHAAGSPVKLAGLAQRSVRGAALTTAFVVAEGGARLRGVLAPVYAALQLDWDPRTAGAAQDAVASVTAVALEEAVVGALGAQVDLETAALPADVRAAAR